MQRVSRGELTWAAGWAIGVAGLTLAPYLLAWWLTPPGYVFTGILANPLDGFSYLAKMRAATQGDWLLQLRYTTEPHHAALLFPQYVLLGKLVALTGLPPIGLFHATRVLAGLLMLGAGYAFIVTVFEAVELRKTAFLLLATSGGLTWFTSFFGLLAADVTIPESNTFHSLFSNVHFPLATGLLVLALLVLLKSLGKVHWRWMALAGGTNALMVLLQPFLLLSEVAVALGWALLLLQKRLLPRAAVHPALLLLVVVPGGPLLLLAQQLYGDPVLAQWTAQNITPSPAPWSYLAGYGVLAPLALVGLTAVWRRPPATSLSQSHGLLLVAWAVLGALLLYFPVPWQRRLSEGYHIPLSLLAALGLHTLLSMELGEHPRRLARAGVVAFGMLGSLMLAGTSVLGAQVIREPHYLSLDDREALAWLEANAGPSDIVLASPIMGNSIPAYSSARVYWGHPFETIDAAAKRQRVLDFYTSTASPEGRCSFLREAGITLVYAGSLERRLGGVELRAQPGLEVRFQRDQVALYQVTACATG